MSAPASPPLPTSPTCTSPATATAALGAARPGSPETPLSSWSAERDAGSEHISPTRQRALKSAGILLTTLWHLRQSAQLAQLAGQRCSRTERALETLWVQATQPEHLQPLGRKERDIAQVAWLRQTLWALRHAARRAGPARRAALLEVLSSQPLSPGRMILECALRGGHSWSREDWSAAGAMRGDRRLLGALSAHIGTTRSAPQEQASALDPQAHQAALEALRRAGYPESADRLAASGLKLKLTASAPDSSAPDSSAPNNSALELSTDTEAGLTILQVSRSGWEALDELLTGMSIPCCIQHSLDGELRRPVDGGRWASERLDTLFEARRLLYRALSSARRGLLGQAPEPGPGVRRALWNWLEAQTLG